MPTPSTIAAVGHVLATRAGVVIGDATLRMPTATQGTLSLGGIEWPISGDPSTKTLRGTAQGATVDLNIRTRSLLKGTFDGAPLELMRAVLRPISASEMSQSDPGPTGQMQAILESTPDYEAGWIMRGGRWRSQATRAQVTTWLPPARVWTC
jgi:hypothetical protein